MGKKLGDWDGNIWKGWPCCSERKDKKIWSKTYTSRETQSPISPGMAPDEWISNHHKRQPFCKLTPPSWPIFVSHLLPFFPCAIWSVCPYSSFSPLSSLLLSMSQPWSSYLNVILCNIQRIITLSSWYMQLNSHSFAVFMSLISKMLFFRLCWCILLFYFYQTISETELVCSIPLLP